MNRVSTANNYSTILADFMRSQMRQHEAQGQVSSGKLATDLKGYARDAESLMAARSVQTKVDGFVAQNKLLASRLEVQDLALNTAADSADEARRTIAEALASNRSDGLMAELNNLFSSAVEALNTRFAGRYLFAGGKVDGAPVAARNLQDLTAAPGVDHVFENDGLVPVSRLDDTTTIESGFLADEVGTRLFETFRAVQAYVEANGPFDEHFSQADIDFLKTVMDGFDTARTEITEKAAVNGLNQNRVDKAIEGHEARSDMLTGMIGDIAHVDMAEAISRLQQAQTAVQASAQVFVTLQNSSLLNLLK